jgi:hypothetical protein
MFIGHFAVAFGIKRVAPDVNLGVAVAAATLLDILWPLLVAAGIEFVAIDHGNTVVTPLYFISYPYSHSLAMAAVWAVMFGWMYSICGGSRRASIWLGVAVVSHWFLDLIAHRPDLTLAPGLDARFGFGLWNSLTTTMTVETLLFAGGIAAYLSVTRTRDRIGTWALWGLIVILLLSYVAALFGPPPERVAHVVIADILGTALAVALAVWADNHREPRSS